ncbi:MAG: P-loop NTPase fold protein, partial [Paraclostridium sp.]
MDNLVLKVGVFYLYLIFTFFYNFDIVFNSNLLKENIDSAIISSSLTLFLFYLFVIYDKKDLLKKIVLFLGLVTVYFIIGTKSFKDIYLTLSNFFNISTSLLIFLGIANYLLRIRTLNEDNNKINQELYEEKQGDFERILYFLTNTDNKINTLGINGKFGVGKTFIIDYTLNHLENLDKYEILKIRCLMLEKDEIYPYLSNQLNRILIKNLILTGHSKKIKRTVALGIESKLGGVSNLLNRETNIDDIQNFKEAIMKLKKTIIIVFDDIDRLHDSEKIDKIFSFVSDFSVRNIKVLILYNSANLYNINEKYNRNYLEKFIPNVMDITELSFSKLLKIEINKLNLNEEDFRFLYVLDTPEYLIYNSSTNGGYCEKRNQWTFNYGVEKLINGKISTKLNPTPRKIKMFLLESKEFLDFFKFKIDNRIIIGYIFLKHFLYEDFYEKINQREDFEEIFKINLENIDGNEKFSLQDLDLVKKLILKKDYYKKIESQVKKDYIIRLNDKRIYLYNGNQYRKKDNLNYYLEKFGVTPVDDERNFYDNLTALENKLMLLNIKVSEECYNNFMIYSILNYYLYIDDENNKVLERNQAINFAIKKLKFLGLPNYQSPYKRFYSKFSNAIDEKDLESRKQKYRNLLDEYYHNDGSFEGIFFLEESISEKIVNILKAFGDKDRMIKYLELIYYENNKLIKDEYIEVFIVANLNKTQ